MNNLYSISNDFYYVYEHWLDEKIIYIGKGKGNRAESKARNVYWRAKVGDRIDEVKIIIKGYFLREEDAFTFENILILEHIDSGEELCNVVFNKKISTLFSEEEINDLISKEKSEKEIRRLKRARKKRSKEIEHIYFPSDLLDKPLDLSTKKDLIRKLNLRDIQGRHAGWPIASRALMSQGFKITNKQAIISGVRKRVSFVSSKNDL